MSVSQAPLRDRSIRYVKGVGPHRQQQLGQLGLETLEDACYFAPRRYEDRTHLVAIADLRPGALATVKGRLLAKQLKRIRRGRTILEASIGDNTGILYALWFNQPYLAAQLTIGEELILHGELESRPRLQMIHPEVERADGEGEPSVHMGRIVPVYPLTSGLGQRWMRQVLWAVVQDHAEELDEALPPSLREQRGWPSAAEAVRELHFPSAWPSLEQAKERLAFEELFLFQVALAQRRARTTRTTKPQRYQLEGPLLEGLRARLPFRFTASQSRVLEELLAELREPFPMHRLLQGDVGCGKTIIMVMLIAVAVQSGYQVALMAPTELLAEQHAAVIGGYLEPLGVTVGLLSQGVEPAERKRRAAAIASGALQVVIGTHALIQRGVTFRRLSLVIVDEQHKFGVIQRAHLAKKADSPDVLVVTATPIPRTLALSIYGDLDVSTITELPAGRQPIATRWMRESQREELYALIRRELDAGRQGYVVYPLVEEGFSQGSGTMSRKATLEGARHLRAATQMAKQLQGVFATFKVGLLHGQMAPRTKEQTMRAFARGDIHLLVSTVIVEVGLDVPNATIMVIEHPERFGLAQLHQLRGRIGRGTQPATCVVVSDGDDAELQGRLAAFVDTTDGFALAERDLALRGPGELLGRRQHGWLRFRIANLARDTTLLESAKAEADALIARDPDLRDPAVSVLRRRLAEFRKAAA